MLINATDLFADRLPGMNFAHHCSYIPDPKYPGIYECASIGGAIRDCQKLGKKLLISLGGDTCDGTLGSAANARFLAKNIWNMFLGGQDMPNKRPFLRQA
jgi:chitinase